MSHICQDGIFLPIYCTVFFTYLSVGLPVSRIIPREYILDFLHHLYHILVLGILGGFGASSGDGIGDGLVLCLGGGEFGGA